MFFLTKASVLKKRAEYNALESINESNKEAVTERFRSPEKKHNIYITGIIIALIAAFVTGTNGYTLAAIALAGVAEFFGYLNFKSTENTNNNKDRNSENN